MRLETVRNFAKSLDINPGKRCKADLIRCIQAEEGNFRCYATATQGECDQARCLWRSDCLDSASQQSGIAVNF